MAKVKNVYVLVHMLGGLCEDVVVYDNEVEALDAAEDIVYSSSFKPHEDEVYVWDKKQCIWSSADPEDYDPEG